jgi:hypothetical protein
MSVIRLTFNIWNWNLIGLGAKRSCYETLQRIPSLQTCVMSRGHVAADHMLERTICLFPCRPTDQTFLWQLKFWTLWCCGMFCRIIWYTAAKAVEGPLDAVRSSKLLACRPNWKTSHLRRPSFWHVTAWDAGLRCYLLCSGHLPKFSKWRIGHCQNRSLN